MIGSTVRWNHGGFVCAWLVFAAQAASAGPGLISSSKVSGDEDAARIEINFNCKVEYLHHEQAGNSDRVRIYLDPTSICNGVSPTAAQSHARYRPVGADTAHLVDLEYDGESAGDAILILSFTEPVDYSVDAPSVGFQLAIDVRPAATPPEPPGEVKNVEHRQVIRTEEPEPDYVINLESFQRIPTIADVPDLNLRPQQRIFYSETDVGGERWYRLRLGDFVTVDEARNALAEVSAIYPEAWIDQLDPDGVSVDLTVAAKAAFAAQTGPIPSSSIATDSKSDALMAEARQTMIAGDSSRAIQIYTKVLRLPDNSRHAQAQEYLALAREKNGQMAHARAEYQRYLSQYPDNDGAARVSQRLAALLAVDQQASGSVSAPTGRNIARRDSRNDWRTQIFFSQYYRRDVNQQNAQNEIVSQSALYSDINFDARRRGERFDFSSRLSAGYRNDFLDAGFGSGNESRISYAYADLSDAKTGLRGRLGRQSRNAGGVLGRFDGLNLGYQATERILVNAVVGKPAYSASDGIDSSRTFYGTSVNYGPLLDGLELGLFFIQQDIDGIEDRQAVGGEFRYFGDKQNFWGLVDYDTSYNELGSAFLQGSRRFGSHLTLHGSIDKRHSPFLSAGNALIGQPVLTFQELTEIFSDDEIRQLGLDRSPTSTTYSLGVSHSLTPKLQINADASQSTVDAATASGGVLATPQTRYRYLSTSLIASSLFRDGDVSILSVRYSDSEIAKVISLMLDSRFQFGRTWRVNPRLRVDRRERLGEPDYEWMYSPGIRIQYRGSQKFRVELDAGKQFSERQTIFANFDRESYFVNLGYQAFF